MVKGQAMLISEFSRTTGLSRDTVRFYARLGLLKPTKTAKGGRNPYQLFSKEDAEAAELIRVAQSLGMSLKEVSDLLIERREKGIDGDRRIEIMQRQLERLEAKEAELRAMTSFLTAKIAWLRGDKKGPRPALSICSCIIGDDED